MCYGNASAITVKRIAVKNDLIFTLRACFRTCASSSLSSIFSIAPVKFRELREASPTQVLSRH